MEMQDVDEVNMSSQTLELPSMSIMSEAAIKSGQKMKLPHGFTPGKYAVLCGRGSKCTKSAGNQRLKELVESNLRGYSEARNKVEKTAIVSAIICAVKNLSPDAGFVKYEDGSWWEVEDTFAREKVGCLFRDALHMKYRSSTKAKLARKREANHSSSASKEELGSRQELQLRQSRTNDHAAGGAFDRSPRALNGADIKMQYDGLSILQSRPDFLSVCISQLNQGTIGGNEVGTPSDRPAEASLWLRRACRIVGGKPEGDTTPARNPNSNIYNLDSGDLPDDLSEISELFEEEIFEESHVTDCDQES